MLMIQSADRLNEVPVSTGSPLPTLRPLYDPTGLVRPRSDYILWGEEDTFQHGLDDWVQLVSPSANTQAGGTVTHVARGRKRALLRIPNRTGVSGMIIKRGVQEFGLGRYLIEMKVDVQNVNSDATRPRLINFGIDSCDTLNNRQFFKFVYTNYDESSSTRVAKWSTMNSSGTLDDVPGGGFIFPYNDNKALPVYLAFVINTLTGKYEGFRINNSLKVGYLSSPTDTTLSALTGPAVDTSLTTFTNGFNPNIEMKARTATQTAGALGLHWHRSTFLG